MKLGTTIDWLRKPFALFISPLTCYTSIFGRLPYHLVSDVRARHLGSGELVRRRGDWSHCMVRQHANTTYLQDSSLYLHISLLLVS